MGGSGGSGRSLRFNCFVDLESTLSTAADQAYERRGFLKYVRSFNLDLNLTFSYIFFRNRLLRQWMKVK